MLQTLIDQKTVKPGNWSSLTVFLWFQLSKMGLYLRKYKIFPLELVVMDGALEKVKDSDGYLETVSFFDFQVCDTTYDYFLHYIERSIAAGQRKIILAFNPKKWRWHMKARSRAKP